MERGPSALAVVLAIGFAGPRIGVRDCRIDISGASNTVFDRVTLPLADDAENVLRVVAHGSKAIDAARCVVARVDAPNHSLVGRRPRDDRSTRVARAEVFGLRPI